MPKPGRPTKYRPIMIKWVERYLENCPDELPSLVGFAYANDFSYKRLQEWKSLNAKDLDPEKYPRFDEFQGMLEKLEVAQHKKLINEGVNGTYNAPITKLLLTKHGYSDKTEVNHSGGLILEIGRDDD